jgi:hypothetical protein
MISSFENLLKTQLKSFLKDSSSNGKSTGIFSTNLNKRRKLVICQNFGRRVKTSL